MQEESPDAADLSHFPDYFAHLQKAILAPTKAVPLLPPKQDLEFYRSVSRKFGTELDATSDRLVKLVDRLLTLAKSNNASDDTRPTLTEDDISLKYQSRVVDVVDNLLESVVSIPALSNCLPVHNLPPRRI